MLQKLPTVDLDNVNHRRGARERINQILDHSFDDSKVQTPEEKLDGITPTNPSFPPGDIRRYNAKPDGSDSATPIANATSVNAPLTAVIVNGGAYATSDFDNSRGAAITGSGFVYDSTTKEVYTPFGRRTSLAFGQEWLYALHDRIKDGNVYRATFTGDSTTVGSGVSAPYVPTLLFQKASQRMGAPGCVPVNRGQAGESTADWLTDYLADDIDVSGPNQPHLLVIRWGINDPDTSGDNLTPAETIENIRTGLTTIRADLGVDELSIILCTPNSTSNPSRGRDQFYHEQIGQGFRQAALDFKCAFLDIGQLFHGSAGAGGLWMDDVGSGETVHPTDTMEAVIAWELAKLAFSGCQFHQPTSFAMDTGSAYTVDAADLPATYPTGPSLYRTDSGFPRDGFVLTFNHVDDGQLQINWGFGSAIERTARTRFGRANAWDPWDGEFIAPTLLNSWANVGGSAETAGYTRDMYGRVYLKGRISGGTTTINTPLFTLPVGYRPGANQVFTVTSNNAFGCVQIIAASGEVQILVGNATYLSFEGIQFMATQ